MEWKRKGSKYRSWFMVNHEKKQVPLMVHGGPRKEATTI